jgi:hypothetical protein
VQQQGPVQVDLKYDMVFNMLHHLEVVQTERLTCTWSPDLRVQTCRDFPEGENQEMLQCWNS